MKTTFLFFAFILSYCLYAQKLPTVTKIIPTEFAGTAEIGTTILVDANNDGTFDEYLVKVDDLGMFKQTFNPQIPIGSIIGIKSVVTKGKGESQKVKESKALKLKIIDPASLPTGATATGAAAVVAQLDGKNKALANTILIYKATISNTNFSIPIARFNLNKEVANGAEGNISLFTSIGAGVGISWGRMEVTRDHEGQITNEEYSNTVGFHIGALFSSGTGEDTKNVFAPTLNFAILDFQVGTGYELGTIQDNQRRMFFTISYAIPLYKLVRKAYRVWSIDPYPIASRKGSNLN